MGKAQKFFKKQILESEFNLKNLTTNLAQTNNRLTETIIAENSDKYFYLI